MSSQIPRETPSKGYGCVVALLGLSVFFVLGFAALGIKPFDDVRGGALNPQGDESRLLVKTSFVRAR